jgi:cytochrome c-type biogenesis protein CcmH
VRASRRRDRAVIARRIRVFLIGLLLLATAALAIDTEVAFEDPVLNGRYRALIREVRCPKCQNESIADSHAPVAADLRREIRELLANGATDQQVVDFLLARYGDFVLYRPRVDATTWALWGAPFALLIVGGFVFVRVLKTHRNQSFEEDLT